MLTRIKVREENPLGLLRKQIRGLFSESMGDAIKVWGRRFLPLHFTPSARRRYDYAKRTKAYEIRKAYTKGHRRPLVWSGESERAARRAMEVQTFSGRARARGVLRGPRHLFIRNPIGVDKTDEITRIIPAEQRRLTEVAGRLLARRMRQGAVTKTKTLN